MTKAKEKPQVTEAETLRGQLRAACDEQSKVQAEIFQLQQRERDLARQIDSLATKLERLEPEAGQAHAARVRDYLDRQKEITAGRRQREQQLLAAGAEPGEIIVHRAPIDGAMAQRRRGQDRPDLRRTS